MYVAKARGRDQVRLYDEALRRRIVEHLDTESGLRAALDAGDLVVHWQPVFTVNSLAVCGVEALVRWEHEERGLILPAEFLGAAALAGLDAPLGAYVLEAACRQLASWESEGIAPPIVWLNLSATQLTWSGTVDRVRATLARYSLDPGRLGFDIAEEAIAEIDRARRASAELAALRELGCPMALDDFGTGHASPLAVRRYGITHVKLDRSIVQTSADDDPMVPALLSLAAMLGVEVLAEGVETEHQLERVRRAGCTAAAGNHLAPAMPADELTALLRASSR
jgi:EAL domain-containing protein (putative c-di-GMP-specific phosphodiesterase class I)